MGSMTKFATETARLVKSFADTAKDNKEAQQDFCSELADSSEETQGVLKLLFAAAEKEMSSLRRSEKSSSKSDVKTDGNDNNKKMTKKEQIKQLYFEGYDDPSEIQKKINCNRRTVTRVISELKTA